MSYRITLKCSNKTDADKYDRDLQMNSYDAAIATFKTLVKGCLEDIIDPYIIEFYFGKDVRYRLEKI